MRTLLHAIFNVVFGTVYFVIVMLNLHSQKMQFSESSQISITEKSIFCHSEVIFLNVWIFSRAGVKFSC